MATITRFTVRAVKIDDECCTSEGTADTSIDEAFGEGFGEYLDQELVMRDDRNRGHHQAEKTVTRSTTSIAVGAPAEKEANGEAEVGRAQPVEARSGAKVLPGQR
ncbi:hypothetical protein VTN96DRAFT_7534 [Rasamsonia emersonii]